MKKLIFTVTNDLNYDQRMHRICSSLQSAGYDVLLVGRERKASKPLTGQSFRQLRLKPFFDSGILFYTEYNIRLFFFLLFQSFDLICAIDLDTIAPCYFSSIIKNRKRVYDAHEFFTELVEVKKRKRIYETWLGIEKFFLPRFQHGYTVSEGIRLEFEERYGVKYALIRNLPKQKLPVEVNLKGYLLYQGAVNEGRCFEQLIPAMKSLHQQLVICGDGNFMHKLPPLIDKYGVREKVSLKGMVPPSQLWEYTCGARIGINLHEAEGLNQQFALANKFFDYVLAGVPQICVDLPEYRAINEKYKVAILIKEVTPETIQESILKLLKDESLYAELKEACMVASKELNWEREEGKLIEFYKDLFSGE